MGHAAPLVKANKVRRWYTRGHMALIAIPIVLGSVVAVFGTLLWMVFPAIICAAAVVALVASHLPQQLAPPEPIVPWQPVIDRYLTRRDGHETMDFVLEMDEWAP